MADFMNPRVLAALLRAQALVDELGKNHPKAMQAIVAAVELADPGFSVRTMAECGIVLPEPSHVDAVGRPTYSSEEIAKAVGVSHEKVLEDIDRLKSEIDIEVLTGDQVHRIQ